MNYGEEEKEHFLYWTQENMAACDCSRLIVTVMMEKMTYCLKSSLTLVQMCE